MFILLKNYKRRARHIQSQMKYFSGRGYRLDAISALTRLKSSYRFK